MLMLSSRSKDTLSRNFGKHHLMVTILKFPKGCLLKVRGKAITPAEGPTQMRVDSFDDITHDKAVVPLTPDQLRACGIVSPKRKYESISSENENKRHAE
ncbi:uncharacterized protein LOC103573047 [Microplitis demolitor]|uniref:uncharacterized protein LOC103573047 n=1 Tax=Microplitis demolitor TaxID=69319 RepID=UPI00235B5FD6|nr:uncharacterized protein LOC103573047 [Microplitis demolitor]